MVCFQYFSWKHLQGQLYENKATPLNPTELTTNAQACAASIQVSSEAKAEEINNISLQTVSPIELQVTRTDDPMVVL